MAEQAEFKLLDTPALPQGFRYQADVISVEQEQDLARQIHTLPFQAFQFRGFEGKRRVVSYGWRYDFNQQKLQEATKALTEGRGGEAVDPSLALADAMRAQARVDAAQKR